MKYPGHVPLLEILICLLLARVVWAQDNKDYTKRSLEDLMNIEVTSVSKKSQKVSATAAAIFVITQDEIRQSGALNIPDLLRMVPGLNVAQISASAWAISARGLNDHYADKLLVMLDGRSVYTHTFSGVYWDGLDLPIEDIERIEVVRGPGGSSWGANAVNGVINIITKKASQTHGGMIVAGAGNLQQGFGTVQYGSRVGHNTDYEFSANIPIRPTWPDSPVTMVPTNGTYFEQASELTPRSHLPTT
jgi:iron complex outermembrane recepter protein